MNRSTFWIIKYMNRSVFSKARYMNGVGFEMLARTLVPKLPLRVCVCVVGVGWGGLRGQCRI